MSRDRKRYIRYYVDEDFNLVDVDASWYLGFNIDRIPGDTEYVYVMPWSYPHPQSGRLIWSRSKGYVDMTDDPDFKQYEKFKELLTERYGSIEN